MEYRSLGRTGVMVSPLCLGAWQFGARTPREDALRMVDMALEVGVNFFDTATAYGDGLSETLLGEALARDGKRARAVVASKFSHGITRRAILEQCDATLRRLQTDHVDLYQFHGPWAEVPIDESLRALDDLVRAGKVRYIGTSNFTAWHAVEALWAAHTLNLPLIISEQPAYNLLDRRAELELVPMARTYNLALIPWSPLAQGFLTGKYRRETDLPEDARLATDVNAARTEHFLPAAYDVVDMLIELAAEKGCSVSQLALGWCIGQPGITSPIVGPRTAEQLVDNLGALDISLSDEDRQRIDAAAPPGGMVLQYFRIDQRPRALWR